MKEFQKRLYIERFNLNRKLIKLNNALINKTLPPDAVEDLEIQANCMGKYLFILEKRISDLEKSTGDGYNDWNSDISFDFGTAIELLEEGYAVSRSGWNGKGLVVIKQIPSHITGDIIPNMQSLPSSAKNILMSNTKFIDYSNQNLIININTGEANSWVPSSSDMYAKDWIIISE